MDSLEIRLEYQKETGLTLDTINAIVNKSMDEDDTKTYIEWLENKLNDQNKN